MLKINHISEGDCLTLAKELEPASIQTIITSPPYYGLRSYSESNLKEIGKEKTPEAYIENLALLFQILKDKLRDEGSLWLNLGDVYINKAQQGMPWRVALALIDQGWILRNDVIWNKPNAMPCSVKDRLTVSHEYIFFFTKAKDYFFNLDAIREPHVTFSPESKMRGGRKHFEELQTPEKGKY